jgi:hypothetical protein
VTLTGRLAVDQTREGHRVEPRHPIAHYLQRDATGLGSARSVVDRCQRQEPPDLIGILTLAAARTIIQPQRDRPSGGEPPLFAGPESDRLRVGESLGGSFP